ncbi:ATP-binding protein [Rufibacter psychrotolerans]|uniref:ATP-binding protein n=1 Tax=Rufibacter psychrotolerans TaxID=2812556 RepID=UPI0019675091|nr:ATP-binding protein [Rufibacter sp. SYSU D00308]
MPKVKETFSLQSIRGKIIAAVLLGVLAVAMSWSITHKGFNNILQTVADVSAPNEKLRTVNSLFQSLAQLDQLQRAHATRTPTQPQNRSKAKIKQLQLTLDSLRGYCAGNPQQLRLLDSMEIKLLQREKLYNGYMKLRTDMNRNEALSRRIAAISQEIAKSKPQIDSTVVTARKKITTTTIWPPGNDSAETPKKHKQSFFGRLFGGRKEEELPAALKQVQEELQVQVDTLTVARQDSIIWRVEKMMRRVEREHHQRTTQLLSREMQWVTANSQLHSQLLGILRTIEAEEVAAMQQNNRAAKELVNGSIDQIDHIMVLFSLGSALFVFLIFLDISRSNRYRKALIAAKEEAEQLGQVKQQFLANMSHEIRTPLQAILGFSEQIRTQEKPSRKALDAIYQSSEHLLHIVNEVLDYSRIVSGKFTFEQRPFDMQQLVTEVVETMQVAAHQKGLPLELEYGVHGGQRYAGDPFRLRQMLYNLLSNAIKFTDAGGVTVSVFAEDFQKETHFRFQVSDTGVGIPVDKLEAIFHSFEQAHDAVGRTRGGTGLGLSIVKALAEGQNGTVEVQSAPGKGSVFQLQLPFAKAPQPQSVPTPLLLPDQGKAVQTGKVLVVDDDAFILELCGAILRKHEVACTCTHDAASVLHQEWDEAIGLVLLDIRMPGMNGMDVCRALREKISADVQIFALTAEALPEERESILAQGFDGLLMKPFREQELMAVVHGIAVTGPMPAGEAPVVGVELDLSPLRQMLGHDEEMLKAVLAQFITETGQDLEGLTRSLSAQHPAEVQEALHRLAGRTGQVGAKKLSGQLRKVETLLRAQEPLQLLQPEILQLTEDVLLLKKIIQEKAASAEVLLEE